MLVDTSVWVDHLREGDQVLVGLLHRGEVLVHESVIGEISLGGASTTTLDDLQDLPPAVVASHEEVMGLVARERLVGSGVGWVDAHLLAATLLAGDALLWSRDEKLAAVADRLGVGIVAVAEPGGG